MERQTDRRTGGRTGEIRSRQMSNDVFFKCHATPSLSRSPPSLSLSNEVGAGGEISCRQSRGTTDMKRHTVQSSHSLSPPSLLLDQSGGWG